MGVRALLGRGTYDSSTGLPQFENFLPLRGGEQRRVRKKTLHTSCIISSANEGRQKLDNMSYFGSRILQKGQMVVLFLYMPNGREES